MYSSWDSVLEYLPCGNMIVIFIGIYALNTFIPVQYRSLKD